MSGDVAAAAVATVAAADALALWPVWQQMEERGEGDGRWAHAEGSTCITAHEKELREAL